MIGRVSRTLFRILKLLWKVPFLALSCFFFAWAVGVGLILYSVCRLKYALGRGSQIDLSYIDPFGHYHPLSFFVFLRRDPTPTSVEIWPIWQVIEKDPLQYKHALLWLQERFKRKTPLWRAVRYLLVSYYTLLIRVNPGSNPYSAFFHSVSEQFRNAYPTGTGGNWWKMLCHTCRATLTGRFRDDETRPIKKRGEELRGLAQKGVTQRLLHELDGETDLEHPDESGWTLLFHAVKGGDETVKALVERGADLNARDILGHTMISICARYGYLEQAKFLIGLGAEVNTREEVLGRTPLMVASYCGHTPLVQFLLKAGADTEAVDDLGKTALNIAEKSGRDEVVEVLNHGLGSMER